MKDHDVTGGLAKGSGTIAVGAAGFTEGKILATIYADVLKGRLRRHGARGRQPRALPAGAERRDGDPGVPEYLSTVTEAINKQVNGPNAAPVASGDAAGDLAAVKPLAAKQGLTSANRPRPPTRTPSRSPRRWPTSSR